MQMSWKICLGWVPIYFAYRCNIPSVNLLRNGFLIPHPYTRILAVLRRSCQLIPKILKVLIYCLPVVVPNLYSIDISPVLWRVVFSIFTQSLLRNSIVAFGKKIDTTSGLRLGHILDELGTTICKRYSLIYTVCGKMYMLDCMYTTMD